MRLTLRALISHSRVARRIGLGPESRINILRNILTGLVRHERIETTRARADEVRFYAEKASSILLFLYLGVLKQGHFLKNIIKSVSSKTFDRYINV